MERSYFVVYIGSPQSAWFVCLVSYAVITQSSPQGGPGKSTLSRYKTPTYGSPERETLLAVTAKASENV